MLCDFQQLLHFAKLAEYSPILLALKLINIKYAHRTKN